MRRALIGVLIGLGLLVASMVLAGAVVRYSTGSNPEVQL